MMTWPEPRNLNTLEEISKYCTMLYEHLTQESSLRIGDFAQVEQLAKRYSLLLAGNQGVDNGEYNSSGVMTTDQIGDAAIEVANIADNAVETAKIAADAVVAAKIAVSGLDGTSGDVAANHIVAGMLQSNCVTTVKLQADSVTAPKINVVGLDGTSGRICVADATDANVVTGGVNSYATTLIQAGKILISGSTPLSDWSHATDATLIDGGEIYTGSITATQIATNTITVDKLTTGLSPNLLKAKYTDFQSFANDDNIGTVYDGTATCDTGDFYIGDRCLKMIASAANNITYLGSSSINYNIRLEPSTKYIVSYYAKASSGTPTVGGYIKQDDTALKTLGTTTITTSWVRYQFTVTTDINLTDSGVLRINNDTDGATVWFDAIQVEKASAATSPEATPYKPSGVVEIHGGQIEADTITATQIDAGTITADKLVLGQRQYWYSRPTDSIKNSNDTERTLTSTSYAKKKETKVNEDTGEMRIYFELKSGASGQSVYGRVYVNGEAVGTEQSIANDTYVEKIETLGGFNKDDLIQIYTRAFDEGNTVYVRYFRFKYDRAVTIVAGAELDTPLSTVSQTAFDVTNTSGY